MLARRTRKKKHPPEQSDESECQHTPTLCQHTAKSKTHTRAPNNKQMQQLSGVCVVALLALSLCAQCSGSNLLGWTYDWGISGNMIADGSGSSADGSGSGSSGSALEGQAKVPANFQWSTTLKSISNTSVLKEGCILFKFDSIVWDGELLLFCLVCLFCFV